MLKFKNAQTLSRTEMKNLTGGTTSERRPACFDTCFFDYQTSENYCPNGKSCEEYLCDNINPNQPKYAKRCV